MTKQEQTTLARINALPGMTARYDGAEFVVNFKHGDDWDAFYTDSPAEALETATKMAYIETPATWAM